MATEREWTWVKDLDTGHLYDVPTESLPLYEGAVQVIAAKGTHYGESPRAPKHNITRTSQTTSASADGAEAAQAAIIEER